ncbi:MAG TPA: hypothetical protein VKQ08_06295 [Cyclobacteriaceae bacterium]|nr:hypothetical protein [Cyclobacteriaceae bacterium]
MANIGKTGRVAYCIGLSGMVLPQIFYGKISGSFLANWPGLPWVPVWAYLFGIFTIIACIAVAFDIKGRSTALVLGGLLLTMLVFGSLSFELFIDPDRNHLFAWGGLLTGLAITGGAFVVAGSFTDEATDKKPAFIRWLGKLIPLGPLFFCTTIITYGCFHFAYPKQVFTLFPGWVPYRMFWTYFFGVALVIDGLAIVFSIKRRLAAILLGAMLLMFLIIIHIPLAIADPLGANAFQLTRIFGALAFSATAFLIAFKTIPKRQGAFR